MTVTKHELRQGRAPFAIWTASIAALMAVCILLYPEMEADMQGVSDLFASMGAFTQAFGMDRLALGTLLGFYAVECGNVLGLGGAMFAAMTGACALSCEERERTADFLLSHPVSRVQVAVEKLIAVLLQVLAMNAVLLAVSLVCIAGIGEEIPFEELLRLHTAYLLMQAELACLCFGLSAVVIRGSAGAGLGIALMAYFLNLTANIADSAHALRYVTPFAYAEGAEILESGHLDGTLILLGAVYAAAAVAAGVRHYARKDIR